VFSIPYPSTDLTGIQPITTVQSEYLITNASGKLLTFSSNSQKTISIFQTDHLQSQAQEIPFTWSGNISGPQPSRLAWNDALNIVAIYKPTYLSLVNIGNGTACAVDLGLLDEEKLWHYYATWSPDGRFLVMLTMTGVSSIHSIIDFRILDVSNGTISLISQINNLDYTCYVTDVSWAPDGKTLAALIKINNKDVGLYLVDATTGKLLRILKENTFYSGYIGRSMTWSPGGNRIAFICENGPICLGLTACLALH
jgi:WD40 repeat protein